MEVILLAAMTADGFIARFPEDRSFDWTSPEDKQFYVSKIKAAGTVIMGSKSFQTFSRYPKGLTFIIYSSKPEEFVNPRPDVITAYGTKDEPKVLLEKLKQQNVREIAICGGSSIYSMWMKSGLVDRLYLTIEPVLFGKGVGLFDGSFNANLKLEQVHQLSSETVVLEYVVAK